MSLIETDFYFYIKGKRISPAQVIEVMATILTPERKAKIQSVIDKRTLDIVVALDGIHDLGNLSAILRSADAFGLQEIHFVENQRKYKVSHRTSKGADKWLDFRKWKQSSDCAKYLKEKGYKICATHLDEKAKPIEQIDFSQKTAFVLGNEKDGVSKEILEMADETCIIPMQGFAQSFNVSVAAALCFYHIYSDRIRKLGHHGNLTPEQRQYLLADFYMRSSDNAEIYF